MNADAAGMGLVDGLGANGLGVTRDALALEQALAAAFQRLGASQELLALGGHGIGPAAAAAATAGRCAAPVAKEGIAVDILRKLEQRAAGRVQLGAVVPQPLPGLGLGRGGNVVDLERHLRDDFVGLVDGSFSRTDGRLPGFAPRHQFGDLANLLLDAGEDQFEICLVRSKEFAAALHFFGYLSTALLVYRSIALLLCSVEEEGKEAKEEEEEEEEEEVVVVVVVVMEVEALQV